LLGRHVTRIKPAALPRAHTVASVPRTSMIGPCVSGSLDRSFAATSPGRQAMHAFIMKKVIRLWIKVQKCCGWVGYDRTLQDRLTARASPLVFDRLGGALVVRRSVALRHVPYMYMPMYMSMYMHM
jgi:hypothetical protein